MSWSDILKDTGDDYIAEAARMIAKMADLIRQHADLAGDVYELAEKNGDSEMAGMIQESAPLLDKYIETQMDMINRLNEREERR